MTGITATSFDPARLDVLYLDQYYRMMHVAYNPSASDVDLTSPLMTSIIGQNLGGAFATSPVAVATALTQSRPPTPVEKKPVETAEAARIIAPGPPHTDPVAPVGPISTDPGGPGGPPDPAKTQQIDVFALDQNHLMRMLVLPQGVAPVSVPAGGIDAVADFATLGSNTFISAPAAVAAGGQVSVFGVQSDRTMAWCSSHWTDTGEEFDGWTSLGGIFTSAPTAVAGGLGSLDVFGRDANFQLAHMSINGTTPSAQGWENLGAPAASTTGRGGLASPPVAISWGPNRIDVFALSAADGSIGHTWWDGERWNDWQPLVPPTAVSFVGTPSAITWGPNRLDVFVSGTDSNLYHFIETTGAFGAPEMLGAAVSLPANWSTNGWTPSPTAISLATDHVVVLGLANQWNDEEEPITPVAGYRIWDGAVWRGWASLDSVGLPSRYRFSVDTVICQTSRAPINDSDTATASMTAGNGQTQTVSQSLGDLSSSDDAQANLVFFEPVEVALCDTAIFSYQVMNSGASAPNDINTALENLGLDLAQYALKAVEGDLSQGLASIAAVPIATGLVAPVIGSLLGLLASWLQTELPISLTPNHCDGMVAIEQAVLLGTQLASYTTDGKVHSVSTENEGQPLGGCHTSEYQVLWSITQV